MEWSGVSCAQSCAQRGGGRARAPGETLSEGAEMLSGNGERAVGHGQWAMGNGPWAMGHGRPPGSAPGRRRRGAGAGRSPPPGSPGRPRGPPRGGAYRGDIIAPSISGQQYDHIGGGVCADSSRRRPLPPRRFPSRPGDARAPPGGRRAGSEAIPARRGARWRAARVIITVMRGPAEPRCACPRVPARRPGCYLPARPPSR